MLTDEPRPRNPPRSWRPFRPAVAETEPLAWPEVSPSRDFDNVLHSRRSKLAGSVARTDIAALLWHAVGTKGHAPSGRAGIPIEWRASPSSGGLHPIHLVCINDHRDARVRLYDALDHAFHVLDVDHKEAFDANALAARQVLGAHRGCTLRLIADIDKVGAAYENPESLILRDAGCLVATLCLCAEWLGLAACPLGFLGGDMVRMLGFPEPRFRAVGAVQITKP